MSTNYTIPRIYCINLKTSTQRKNRMEYRLKHHNLLDQTTFINAISKDSPFINDYFFKDMPYDCEQNKCLRTISCYASHIKAIRTFLEDGGEECLICEDDIMFHNDFKNKYFELRENIPDDTPFIGLSYMITEWKGFWWAGKKKDLHNLCSITNPQYIWGMQLYWMSKQYAVEVLKKYDKPCKLADNDFHSSEIILKKSNGFIAYPMLAIEDSIDSDRASEDLPYHRNHFNQWGRNNFNAAEPETELKDK